MLGMDVVGRYSASFPERKHESSEAIGWAAALDSLGDILSRDVLSAILIRGLLRAKHSMGITADSITISRVPREFDDPSIDQLTSIF